MFVKIICDIMELEKTGHVSAEIRDDVLSYQPKVINFDFTWDH